MYVLYAYIAWIPERNWCTSLRNKILDTPLLLDKLFVQRFSVVFYELCFSRRMWREHSVKVLNIFPSEVIFKDGDVKSNFTTFYNFLGLTPIINSNTKVFFH